MQEITNAMQRDMNALIECVEGLTIDVEPLKDESVDEACVDWYRSRVQMLLDDDCPEAINAYLMRLYKDDSVNAVTQLFALKAVMDLQTEYYDKRKS